MGLSGTCLSRSSKNASLAVSLTLGIPGSPRRLGALHHLPGRPAAAIALAVDVKRRVVEVLLLVSVQLRRHCSGVRCAL